MRVTLSLLYLRAALRIYLAFFSFGLGRDPKEKKIRLQASWEESEHLSPCVRPVCSAWPACGRCLLTPVLTKGRWKSQAIPLNPPSCLVSTGLQAHRNEPECSNTQPAGVPEGRVLTRLGLGGSCSIFSSPFQSQRKFHEPHQRTEESGHRTLLSPGVASAPGVWP